MSGNYLDQLVELGLAILNEDSYFISWEDVYTIISDPEHAFSFATLGLPEGIELSPILQSSGTLDADFSVQITGWQTRQGVRLNNVGKILGGMITINGNNALIDYPAWQVIEAVRQFCMLAKTERTKEINYQHWGRIRRLAVAACSNLSSFLRKSIVLTPDTLRLDLESYQYQGSSTHRVSPTFEGAPEQWLSVFDRNPIVHDYYKLDGEDGGSIYVAVTPPAAKILREIKRMPQRIAMDERARTFIRNPYAVLGEDIAEVLSAEAHENELQRSGFATYRFEVRPKLDNQGNIQLAELLLKATGRGVIPQEENLVVRFPDELEKLITTIRKHQEGGFNAWLWDGYEIELSNDISAELEKLDRLLDRWLNPALSVTYESIFDFSQYSQRVLDIANRKPYYSPFVLKKDNESPWIPSNTLIVVAPSESDPANINELKGNQLVFEGPEDLLLFDQVVKEAKQAGQTQIQYGNLRQPISMVEAEESIVLAKGALEAVAQHKKPGNIKPTQRSSFVIIRNFEDNEYIEGGDLGKGPASMSFDKNNDDGLEIPRSIRGELKQHQRIGVAWLQHLFQFAPRHCTGCVMADDMGLGKTLQLLAFIAKHLENKNALPVLVVAPVSLLENWQLEMRKFFDSDFARVLTLYGKVLSEKKVPKVQIDKRLAEEKGLANFLIDGWKGNANIILTTYETLRDLSISLGRETWGIMVCDEAQKIKTPGTLVTDAAKAQKAHFKIACTGTPVENSLVDLWCLLDFAQPGLLGPLNTFGLKYRRPIEIERSGDPEHAKTLLELRSLVEPYILRRTKADIAKDLPTKFDDRHDEIRNLNRIRSSDQQLQLYNLVIQEYKQLLEKMKSEGNRQNPILMMLHRLRSVCADPRPFGLQPDLSLSVEQYRRQSPKFDWLIERLDEIHRKNEKVLVFTEFIELQRLLQHYIGQRYQLGHRQPRIINGSVKSTDQAVESRQKFVDEFQGSSGFNILILSPIAAGVGLNIQAANHVIHYTRTWNPAKEDQATDRAYRIGSTKDVYVYYPTIYSDDFLTFEDKLDQLLRRKRDLAADILNGTPEISIQEFNDVFGEEISGDSFVNEQYVTVEHLPRIIGHSFESFCREIWKRQGYNVLQTPSSGDGGIDLIAYRNQEGLLIQCKSSATSKSLGWEAIKDVVAGAPAYEKQFSEVKFRKVAVTNQHFNSKAIEQASHNNVHLIDNQQISEWIRQYPIELSCLVSQ